jgi:hypothetical protein
MTAREATVIAPQATAIAALVDAPRPAERHAVAAPHVADQPFSGFLASTGHRVLHGAGAYWYDASPGFFLSLPAPRLLQPSADELRALLRHQPCAGLRFPSPLDGPGKLSYQIVCDTRGYGLESLSANARSKVRRGLRRGTVAPVSFATIAAEGMAADRDTLARQGRALRLDGGAWERFWNAAAATAGMEGWAVYAGGQMAAFLVSVQFDDSVEFLLARSRSDYLDAYPNNALIFEVAREMLGRRELRQVTFGLESLEPVGPLDQFKFGMGFRAAPLRQRVVFHPLLRALLRRRSARALLCRYAAARGVQSGFWRKTLGLVRFAEAGGELDAGVGRTA